MRISKTILGSQKLVRSFIIDIDIGIFDTVDTIETVDTVDIVTIVAIVDIIDIVEDTIYWRCCINLKQ